MSAEYYSGLSVNVSSQNFLRGLFGGNFINLRKQGADLNPLSPVKLASSVLKCLDHLVCHLLCQLPDGMA